jgi:hypothetical protein
MSSEGETKTNENPNSESREEERTKKKRHPDVRRDHKSPLLFVDRSSTANLFSFTKEKEKSPKNYYTTTIANKKKI